MLRNYNPDIEEKCPIDADFAKPGESKVIPETEKSVLPGCSTARILQSVATTGSSDIISFSGPQVYTESTKMSSAEVKNSASESKDLNDNILEESAAKIMRIPVEPNIDSSLKTNNSPSPQCTIC